MADFVNCSDLNRATTNATHCRRAWNLKFGKRDLHLWKQIGVAGSTESRTDVAEVVGEGSCDPGSRRLRVQVTPQ
jgi:hypothetical protein